MQELTRLLDPTTVFSRGADAIAEHGQHFQASEKCSGVARPVRRVECLHITT